MQKNTGLCNCKQCALRKECLQLQCENTNLDTVRSRLGKDMMYSVTTNTEVAPEYYRTRGF